MFPGNDDGRRGGPALRVDTLNDCNPFPITRLDQFVLESRSVLVTTMPVLIVATYIVFEALEIVGFTAVSYYNDIVHSLSLYRSTRQCLI
jgi:hypothetical protein